MQETFEILHELDRVIAAAHLLPKEVAHEVELVLEEGRTRPLNRREAAQLLTKAVGLLKESAIGRGDDATLRSLGEDVQDFVRQALAARERLIRNRGAVPLAEEDTFRLVSHNGVHPGAVHPTPIFHGRQVPMNSGFAHTRDLRLWEGNERLEIHLAQFKEQHGRAPDPEELLDIMLSRMELPGLPEDQKKDQFAIVGLARSIAINGVRKPPILDTDGTLLDGNRRLAACHFILNSDEFTSEEKRRAEYLFVWQLTEHATDDHREAVVVSLNFESDHKEDWPEYVKARKVHEHWQAMLSAEATSPGPRRQGQLKKELSQRFALGPDTSVLTRYLKMVDWILDFEDYHIREKGKDPYEVKHRASRYFQYFDELAKGERGGVAYALRNDDAYRHLVFDLLFDGKFGKWARIRDLRYIHENEEALDHLRKARETPDPDEAEEFIDQAGSIARMRRAETRTTGSNTRIEVFVKWLEELPVSAFRDQIKPQNLRRLLQALQLVEAQARLVLGPEELSHSNATG